VTAATKHCTAAQVMTSAAAAMTFVSEAETWPVFCAFMEKMGAPVPFSDSPEVMRHQVAHCLTLAGKLWPGVDE
jgi:hypothetical protein